jgi:hypothetical protein
MSIISSTLFQRSFSAITTNAVTLLPLSAPHRYQLAAINIPSSFYQARFMEDVSGWVLDEGKTVSYR